MHESKQKFGCMSARPKQGPTQDLDESEHQTQVASCPGVVFGYFPLKNRRKCMQHEKFLKIGMHACGDAAWVWKKFRVILWSCKKNVLRRWPPVDPNSAGYTWCW